MGWKKFIWKSLFNFSSFLRKIKCKKIDVFIGRPLTIFWCSVKCGSMWFLEKSCGENFISWTFEYFVVGLMWVGFSSIAFQIDCSTVEVFYILYLLQFWASFWSFSILVTMLEIAVLLMTIFNFKGSRNTSSFVAFAVF